MPFVPNTPESLLKRTDSKDPATTCHGVTQAGNPCRTAIKPLPGGDKKKALLDAGAAGDERLYCSRHKSQAVPVKITPGAGSGGRVDTFADRLGLDDEDDASSSSAPVKESRLKQEKFTLLSGLITVSNPLAKPLAKLAKLSLHDDSEPASQSTSHSESKPTSFKPNNDSSIPTAYRQYIPASASPETVERLVTELEKPISEDDVPGYIYIFWLTPEEALNEKPVQRARTILGEPADDDEYTQPRGQAEDGSRGLRFPSRPDLSSMRTPSDVLSSFADAVDSLGWLEDSRLGDRIRRAGANILNSSPPDDTGAAAAAVVHPNDDRKRRKNTLLLKIGRATNVQRRMNEWKRQCGYDLALIRYYPYVSSSNPHATGGVRKMPHSHKIERLIHLELRGAGLGVSDYGKCETCGRTHKEWFEIEASRQAIEEVDHCIQRWSNWDEGKPAPS